MTETHDEDQQNQSALEELEESLQSGNYHQALRLLQVLISAYPRKPELLVLLGKCYLKIGSPINALLHIRKLGPASTDNTDLLELVKETYEALFLNDQAMQVARHLIQMGGASESTYASYGRFLIDNAHVVEAFEMIRDGLAKYPASQELKYLLSLAHLHVRETEEATARADELKAEGSPLGEELAVLIAKGIPKAEERVSPEAHKKAEELIGQATELMAESRVEAAVHALTAALREDPGQSLAYTRLGYIYDGCGLFDEGLSLHTKALKYDPGLIEAYRNIAFAYHKVGEFRQAIDAYTKALEFEPDNVDVHNNLGVVYDTLGNYEKGMEHFRHSLKIDPKREDTWRNLGYAYQAQGLVDDAIAAYKSALKVDPLSPSRLQLATLYRVLRQYKEAKKELLAIVEDKPESVAALLELAICYKELKQKKKFSETFEKARALHAKTPSEAFTKGQLMEMLDERAAVDCWTAYLAMAGEVPHEAKRYQYAQERREALMRKLGMTPPPAHIIEPEASPPEEGKL